MRKAPDAKCFRGLQRIVPDLVATVAHRGGPRDNQAGPLEPIASDDLAVTRDAAGAVVLWLLQGEDHLSLVTAQGQKGVRQYVVSHVDPRRLCILARREEVDAAPYPGVKHFIDRIGEAVIRAGGRR